MEQKSLNNFNGVSPDKIKLINEIIKQSESVPNDKLIPFFLDAASKAQSHGITFSDKETDIIISALKTNMTPAEINKIDTIRNLAKMIAVNKTT